LDVLVAPSIAGDPESTLEFIEGQELNLECVYSGQPTPTVEWKKDDLALTSHVNVRIYI
jgi:hypothetical protein